MRTDADGEEEGGHGVYIIAWLMVGRRGTRYQRGRLLMGDRFALVSRIAWKCCVWNKLSGAKPVRFWVSPEDLRPGCSRPVTKWDTGCVGRSTSSAGRTGWLRT